MRYLPVLIFFIPIFLLNGNEIYKINFNSDNRAYIGEPVCRIYLNENPVDRLVDVLGMGKVVIRKEKPFYYISTTEGSGYIPVLSFHKLGNRKRFELERGKFEELLIYLNNNSYHIISGLQFFREDYTFAENGCKIVVLGADDAGKGAFYYETSDDLKNGKFIVENGSYKISDQSMVYYLNKHLEMENGRRNFTFFITFDAIPFRQTGGFTNPGYPYQSMEAVKSKFHYLEENFFIGNHTKSHLFTEKLGKKELISEIKGFYEVIDSYGIDISRIITLAYSFGIGEIKEETERIIRDFEYSGVTIKGAFDYNGFLAKPLSNDSVNPFDVSRIGVDNSSFNKIMSLLAGDDMFRSRRIVLIDAREYPFKLSELELGSNDSYFILVRGQE